MDYKTELTTLAVNIQSAIDKANALPEPTEPNLQSKTVTPSTSQQTVTPDDGFDGLSKVTVNAMPTATQATPSIEVSTAGLITAKATQSAGYVAAGTKQATKQLTTQAAKTITPSTSAQTAVASGRYTTGAVTVAAIPDQYLAEAEVTAQDALIANILAALDGKAAGGSGGGVETCTVSYNDGGLGLSLIYTSYVNGEFGIGIIDTPNESDPYAIIQIENVVKGSYIFVVTGDSVDWVLTGAELGPRSEVVSDYLGGSYSFKVLSDATITA